MVTHRRTLSRAIALWACLLLANITTNAQDNPYINVLRGDQGKLVRDTELVTADLTYVYNQNNPRYDTTTVKYGNIISLVLNQQSSFYISSNFSVTVPLHITMVSATEKDAGGAFKSVEIDTSLTLNYRKDSGTYIARSFLVDSGYRYVTVKIRNDITSNVSWDVTKVLTLENEMRVTRDYFFARPGSGSAGNSFAAQSNESLACGVVIDSIHHQYILIGADTATDEIRVKWADARANQTGYDLEWAWVDQGALNGYQYGGKFSDELVFANNASRVTLDASKLEYAIPTLYDDSGKLFYRVRPVQDRSDGSRLEGAWTKIEETTRTNAFDFTGHQTNLNWQVTTSYAEEGKRKTVIQYFDGTLRSRQTVTKDNVQGTTVVAETMYDYQGRPAIQVLPAPTLNSIIGFAKNFNQGSGVNGEYTKGLYDGLNTGDIICLKPAEKMSTTRGASQYYSTANPEAANGINRYIPDAQQYPFTETRYTPDATGRIAAQSGVGIAHTLGSGHETRYYYGQADQEDLDPLFGTDVGYASHYFKNMVRDANGQYSVSYVDMHGRTVATALAGKRTDTLQLQPLPSLIGRNSVTKKLLDKETNIVKGRYIESQKELLVPITGSYRFRYSLDPETLGLLDKNASPVCYSCMYDLEIQLSNDCGNCNLPGNQPIYIRRTNFSLAKLDSICPAPNDTAHRPARLAIDTSITLQEGSYTVRKTLTLSQQAQDNYRDGLYTRRNTVRSFDSTYQQILAAMLAAGTNCEAAQFNPGTTPLEGIRNAMLLDMMPDSGQYANSSTPQTEYNIFDDNKWKTPIPEGNSNCYYFKDRDGSCISPGDFSRITASPQVFVAAFQQQWAENLITYHPEYIRLNLAENPNYLKPSYDFDNRLRDSMTWAGATQVLSASDIVGSDPFFSRPENYSDASTMAGYINGTYKSDGNGNQWSMWQLACAAVACQGAAASNCISTQPTQFGNFPSGACVQDQDMIWNVFRQMYFFEKQKMVYTWMNAWITNNHPNNPEPTATQLAADGFTPRFVDPSTLNIYPGGLVGLDHSTNHDTTYYTIPGRDTLDDLYDSNCTALATNWRYRLAVLKNCKPSLTNADIDGLVATLTAICKNGSDENHPFGSSSVAPGSGSQPASFEQAIAAFLASKQMPYTGSCNPWMLSDMDPGLYENAQTFSTESVIIKPDSCICNKLTLLESEKTTRSYPGTLSQYLQQVYGTTIAQGALDTLKLSCNGSFSCKTFATPIDLPPVLQCNGPTQTCIDCKTFKAYKDSFQVTTGNVWPQANHPGDVIQSLDSAFAAFMNYKTGFSKTAFEYLDFNASCPVTGNTPQVCTSLTNAINGYNAQKAARATRTYDGNGCDNTYWYSQYGGHYHGGPRISLSAEMIGGEFVPYYDTINRPQWLPGQLEYVDNFCFDSITVITKLKSPRTGIGYNHFGGTIYSFEQRTYYSGLQLGFAFDLINGEWYMYYQRDPNSSQYSPVKLNLNFDQYRVFKVVIGQAQYHVYIDDKLIGDFNHYSLAGRKFERTFTQGFGSDFRIDYQRFVNYDGTVLMNEDFDHPCSQMARMLTEPCDLNNCEQRFASYYNTTNGTNYTFQQLDDISFQNCRKHLQVCSNAPIPPQNLDSIVKAFVYKRDQRLNRHIDPATGCDTTHWASNYGNGRLQVEPLRDVINSENMFEPAFNVANRAPSSLDFYDDICFDSLMTFETRFKLPQTGLGYNPYNSTNFYSLEVPIYFQPGPASPAGFSRFKSNYIWDLNGDSCWMYYTHEIPGNNTVIRTRQALNFNDFVTLRIEITSQNVKIFINGQLYGSHPHPDYNGSRFSAIFWSAYAKSFRVDWIKIYDKNGSILMQEDFDKGCGNLANITRDPCEPSDCSAAFAQFYNNINHTFLSYSQLDSLYTALYGKRLDVCSPTSSYNEPRLCGTHIPKFPSITILPDTCGSELPDLAFNKATEVYRVYRDSLRNVFDTAYYNKCIRAAPPEKLTVTYDAYEYHYTLYYYDQAGNLVQTVPPAGAHPVYDTTWLADVAARRATNGDTLRPAHTLRTQYRYNTLNQMVEQQTPDAGKSNFWYDRLGRLVVSQNAKQATTNRYSYSLYDGIGRITEVGQKPKTGTYDPLTQDITQDTTALTNWMTVGNNKEEITRTVYDVAYEPLAQAPTYLSQQHLRNRVSYTLLYDKEADQLDVNILHKAATYYSYDIHGNVDTLLQDINQSAMRSDSSVGNRFKRVEYSYDLISGKVNAVAYQRGKTDQFFHRYSYDAENRITDVLTSPDNIYWERDAQYKYYKHGPLVRTVLGQLQVQGMDYAYTLQGWMKGINSTNLQTADDMGGDGVSSTTPARDVLGFSLNYYTYAGGSTTYADYQPIGSSLKPFAVIPALPTPAGQPLATGGSLYNGNISRIMLNLPKVGEPILYNYTYDQLNRLVAMDAYTGLNTATNVWQPTSTTSYKERVSYDANGNILTYLRNGSGTGGRPVQMDQLTYQYEKTPNTGMLSSNRLRYVHDVIDAGSYGTDIDNQTTLTLAQVQADQNAAQGTDNYQYDAIGNLIKDKAGNLASVSWTVYGKIKEIVKTDNTVIRYGYDAAGNRIAKTVSKGSTVKRTVYVRDAQGNVLAVYTKQNSEDLKQSEVDLYGSSRLGTWKPDRNVQTLANVTTGTSNFVQGQKLYELTNHLGNVLATISDTRTAITTTNTTVDHYEARVATAIDYYPFGMKMPGRTTDPDLAPVPVTGGGTASTPVTVYRHNFDVAASGHPYTVVADVQNNLGNGVWTNTLGAWTSYTGNPTNTNALAISSSPAAGTILKLDFDIANGKQLNLTSFSFYSRSSPTGYANWSLLINGAVAGSGSIIRNSSGNLGFSGTISLPSGVGLNLSEHVVVTMVLSNASGPTGTFRFDQFVLNGYIVQPPMSTGSNTTASSDLYRYAFNGKELDGDLGQDDYDYGMRIHDARLGRFLSVDPLTKGYPWYTPYQFAGNKPIKFIDLDGEEECSADAAMMRDDRAYLEGRITAEQRRDNQVARGMGAMVAGALILDVYVTKGKATQFLLSAQVLGAFEHKRATTPEGRVAQDERSKAALADAFITWGTGKLLGLLGKLFQSAVKEGSFLFRGTTEGWAGSKAVQKAGVTPTSLDPAKATIIGTEASNYGEGVLYISNKEKLPISSEANVLDDMEKEIVVNLKPADFAKHADLKLTIQQSRDILKSMGINIPSRIEKGQINYYLKSIPQMTEKQISEYIQRAVKLVTGKK